jgi:hypothetical protein
MMDKGIPEGSSVRSPFASRETMENLTKLPTHRQGTIKFDPLSMRRNQSPLTLEDTDQFQNLSLISTLRESKLVPKLNGS